MNTTKDTVVLSIDTSAMNTVIVSITIGKKRFEKTSQSRVLKSQMVLPLIEELLYEQDRELTDITDITVALGPGSFTGLRVGCAVANALGFLLDVPVNGSRKLALPVYS
jgi:tRNA threonylcarbamoyl adenosine modification protein YeaZ